MSWLFSSASTNTAQFDELVDKATSELLPPENDETLLLSLQLSDLIRSKSIEAPLALKSIVRRLAHKNPNVQIQSLHVIDVLIKNSGEAFLFAVADGNAGWHVQLEELARSSNTDVSQVSLKYLQNWALAFQSRDTSAALSNSSLVHMYNRLRYVLQFPPASQSLTSSMITSLSAPEWVDDDLCQRCRTAFTVTNRKHHCRNCGGVFCGDCSSKKMKLEHLGIDQEVRVCDGCYKKLSMPGGRSASISRVEPRSSTSPHLQPRPPTTHTSNSRKTQEDLDFERAIAASLAESSANTNASAPPSSSPYPQSSSLPGIGYGYEARTPQVQATPAPSALAEPGQLPSKQLEQEDPDLAAAIRASLAEHQQSASQQASSSTAQAPAPYVYTPQAVPQPSVPSYELTLAEFDAIDSFSAALSTRQLNIEDANELFYKADKSRNKMIRSLEDSAVKAEMLAELNSKLQRAVRLYDHLLEKRISRYSQPQPHGYYQHSTPQQYIGQPQAYTPAGQAYEAPSQYQRQPQQSHPYMSNADASAAAPALQYQPSASYDQPGLHRHATTHDTYAPQQQQPQWQDQQRFPEQQQSQYQQQQAPPPSGATTSFQQHQTYEQYNDEHPAVPRVDDSQYYNTGPQHSFEPASPEAEQTQATAPYASPSQQSQQLPPLSPSATTHQHYQPSSEQYSYTGAQTAPSQVNGSHVPTYDSHGHGLASDTSDHSNPSRQTEHERALYDAQGHKLRLQGYYTPSSFPAVPNEPIGGFPSVPNGEFKDRLEVREQPKQQEAALIEF